MPRKSIKVVNLSEPAESSPSHPEAQGMDDVLSEIKNETPAEPVVVDQPKPKRTPRAKKDDSAPVEEKVVEPVEEEKVVEPTKPEKVSCPDCGKMVSAKTLKYTHKANCKASQPKYSEVHSGTCYQKEEPVEEDGFQRVSCARQMKSARRAEKMAKLAAAAF